MLPASPSCSHPHRCCAFPILLQCWDRDSSLPRPVLHRDPSNNTFQELLYNNHHQYLYRGVPAYTTCVQCIPSPATQICLSTQPRYTPEFSPITANFCQPVEPSVLENTNLKTTPSHSTADLLFFPGLVQSERPDSLIHQGALEFGWCLRCVDPEQYFSSRFLHILLLSVAYRFSLSFQRKVTSTLRGLQRRCTVWNNGISWTDSDNITTLIELLDNNRRVLVAMSCSKDRPMEHAKLRSSLISLVHCLHQEHCPSVEVYECLISPSLVQRYPFNYLPDADLFDIQDIAVSILCRKPFIPSQSENCIGRLPTQSLPFEPYHLLSASSVCVLFNRSNADLPVPTAILHEITKHFSQLKMKPQVYKELREHLDGLSLFAGRNPLVSSVAVL